MLTDVVMLTYPSQFLQQYLLGSPHRFVGVDQDVLLSSQVRHVHAHSDFSCCYSRFSHIHHAALLQRKNGKET